MWVWSPAWVSSSLIGKAFDMSCWWCKLWVHRWLASRVFLGHIYLLRSRISRFYPPFLDIVQGFWWLGLLGAIFLPISTSSFGFSVIGTTDPGSDKVLNALAQYFRTHFMLTNFSGDSRICIKDCADKAKETSLEWSPRSP